MTITQGRQRGPPGKRILAQSAAALSEAELLAVFFRRSGGPDSAIDISSRLLLCRFGGLTCFSTVSLQSRHLNRALVTGLLPLPGIMSL